MAIPRSERQEPGLRSLALRARARVVVLLGSAVLSACGASPVEPAPRPTSTAVEATGPVASPALFSYPDVRGGVLSTSSVRGRITVIGFIATYDLPSQAQVRYLGQLARDHAPRLNVGLVVLEPPENVELVRAYANALAIPFPVAMADAETLRGEGPFAGLHHVPSVVVLDRQGRERFRHLGLLDVATLDAAVRDVEATSPLPK